MLRITVHALGGAREAALESAEEEYFKRLKGKLQLEVKTHSLKNSSQHMPALQVMNAEAALVLEKLKPSDHVWVLERTGKQRSSEEIADLIRTTTNQGVSHIQIFIGGPYGVAKELLDRAQQKLSLSALTFTSSISRFILIEQIYRAYTILQGIPYHK